MEEKGIWVHVPEAPVGWDAEGVCVPGCVVCQVRQEDILVGARIRRRGQLHLEPQGVSVAGVEGMKERIPDAVAR